LGHLWFYAPYYGDISDVIGHNVLLFHWWRCLWQVIGYLLYIEMVCVYRKNFMYGKFMCATIGESKKTHRDMCGIVLNNLWPEIPRL
jgi:hypothetical protein